MDQVERTGRGGGECCLKTSFLPQLVLQRLPERFFPQLNGKLTGELACFFLPA